MVFAAGGLLVSEEALGWLDPSIESESVRHVDEATPADGALLRRIENRRRMIAGHQFVVLAHSAVSPG